MNGECNICNEHALDCKRIKKHYCTAIDNVHSIRCVSFTDNKHWFCLVWIDGSSLLVKYCPFCGESVDSERIKS